MAIRVFSILLLIILNACSDSNQSQHQDDSLSVSITLVSLPNSITYNKPTTPDGKVEYNWGVVFDTNGDGAINQGDIALRILHFKSPGSVEQTGTINDLVAQLWVYTTDTQTTGKVDAKSSLSGNTITISIDKSLHQSLRSINESTQVYFVSSTYDSNAGVSKFDYYPGFYTLMAIPGDGNFTDPQGDAEFQYIDMVSMNISF